MTPLSAKSALDQFFLDARSRLLDLAAILDRIDRGAARGSLESDPRVGQISRALAALQMEGPGRAEAVQRIFSLEYDAAWPRPTPR